MEQVFLADGSSSTLFPNPVDWPQPQVLSFISKFITDSATGKPYNEDNHCASTEIDLTTALGAASYQARWDIEDGLSGVQFQISSDAGAT
jgi:hypothetical protein